MCRAMRRAKQSSALPPGKIRQADLLQFRDLQLLVGRGCHFLHRMVFDTIDHASLGRGNIDAGNSPERP